MPRVKLGSQHLPDTAQVGKLIARYVKIERGMTIDEAATRSGYSKTLYYNRMRDPAGNAGLCQNIGDSLGRNVRRAGGGYEVLMLWKKRSP